MPDFTIVLDPSTAQFYRRVAQSAGLCTEQGELALESLAAKRRDLG